MRDRLNQWLLPDIQKHAKEHHVGYETARICDMEKHAAHAEKIMTDKQKKR